DVSPRVADVMEPEVISVRADSTVYNAVQIIERHRLRGLPVVDDAGRCLGLLSTFKVNHYLFPPLAEATSARNAIASLVDITASFGGTFISGKQTSEVENFVLVIAAMQTQSFSRRIENSHGQNILLLVGDREQIQLLAVAARVRGIILTGGIPASPAVREAAERAGVALLSSPHDTATSVLLARGAIKVERMLSAELKTFRPETSLTNARDIATTSHAFVFPVLDERGTLVGILSKSDFIKPIPRQLILVDHNELSQAVPGAEEMPIVEILDHHRLGGFSSNSPIHFWNYPVGSTSTIVALCYEQERVEIPRDVAGLLMSGLISDTLNLTSPTTTPTDRRVLQQLADVVGIAPAQLADEIFSVGSPLLTLTAEEVVNADCKEYEEAGVRFTVSQIEEMSLARFYEREAELASALNTFHAKGRFYFSALFVTDVNTQNSLLLLAAPPEFVQKIDFPSKHDSLWELPGVVSRKKQLLPHLLTLLKS
ncbi:MAG: manganese-dependent inorganic pyrophosphatase, partial [Chthoniobacter sp.]|nr:manganese-dependent inorganic pyrophosphatase [Chthoniobacter sp.]